MNTAPLSAKPSKRLLMVIVVILAIVTPVAILLYLRSVPERSVVSYCQTYKEEKARLAKLPGDSWPSAVFNDKIGDAGEFAASFRKLDKVAPEEIEGDTATLASVYQKIHDDPSQAVSAAMSGGTADTSLKAWTQSHCVET